MQNLPDYRLLRRGATTLRVLIVNAIELNWQTIWKQLLTLVTLVSYSASFPTYSCYLDVVVGLACCNDPEGCAEWNIRSCGSNRAREAEGEQSDKEQRVLVLRAIVLRGGLEVKGVKAVRCFLQATSSYAAFSTGKGRVRKGWP